MDIIVSLVVVASLVALAVQLGKRLAGRDFNSRPVIVGILAAVGFAVVPYPFYIWLDVDNFSYAGLIVLGGWALVPIVAATVSWILAAPDAKARSLRSALIPTLGLIWILNPISEFFLYCIFKRTIYLDQLFGIAGC